MPRTQIVVIEPRFAQRLLYELELADDGYDVTSYARSSEALAPHGTPVCALLLVDGGNQVPVAVEQVRKVRRVFPEAAVVVHTASRPFVRECPSTLADAVLLKRPDLTVLKRTIRSLLAEACGGGGREISEARGGNLMPSR